MLSGVFDVSDEYENGILLLKHVYSMDEFYMNGIFRNSAISNYRNEICIDPDPDPVLLIYMQDANHIYLMQCMSAKF